MTLEIAIVLTILAAAVVLFISEKLTPDFVALLVLAGLLGSGSVTPAEGVSGLSNPATVTVAAMFVLSAGLHTTGAVAGLGRALNRVAGGRTMMLPVMMVTIGVISAFINNTAAVAVLLPLVMSAAVTHQISASRLLIPLSYASQFGGVCTLIGTSTNLLVSSIAITAGLGAFSMFEFSKLGVIMFLAGFLYLLVFGRWLLPERRTNQLTESFRLGEYVTELRVTPESHLIGKTLNESNFAGNHDITFLELLRAERRMWRPMHEPLAAGDLLLVRGEVKDLVAFRNKEKLELEPEFQLRDETLQSKDFGLVEALVSPQSRLIGRTLKSLDFYGRYNAIVLAIQRRGETLREQLANIHLGLGDSLLLMAPRTEVSKLRADENLIIAEERVDVSLVRGKAPISLAIVVGVVLLSGFNVLPIMVSAILGCVAMALTGCLRLEDAYRDMDWRVLILLAGILPLGIAMEKSGAARLLVGATAQLLGDATPVTMLAALYFLTAVLTECMSNNAAAVLLAPVAISAAEAMGVSAKPLLMAVTFAASTSFATPVGYQTNTMVYNAGGYRFIDFMRVGIPLNLIFWALAVYFIPKFWPF